MTWRLRIELWREVQYSVVADAYSTLCKLQTVQTACRLLQKTASLAGRIPVSIEDDLPDAEGTVMGCFVTLGAPLRSARRRRRSRNASEAAGQKAPPMCF